MESEKKGERCSAPRRAAPAKGVAREREQIVKRAFRMPTLNER